MRCGILGVGTELLFGHTINTNAAYLSKELNNLGFDVLYHFAVGDNEKRLRETIKHAMKKCDLIITTGGLGPTEDDITKETIAKVIKDELVMHAESFAALEKYAKVRGRRLTENNYKQAMMPTKAIIMENEAGTAPGFAVEEDGKIIISLPGPPREVRFMWEHKVKPYLIQKQSKSIVFRMIRTFGIGESLLETKLIDLIDKQSDPTIATYAKEGECMIRVASQRDSYDEAKSAVDEVCTKINEIIGDAVYSFDGEEFHQVIGKALIDKNISISSCESCTGGLFAEQLIRVPGISKVFDRGIVTYSNKSKMDELNVNAESLSKYTAESPEVALEMVRGLKSKTGSRLCISSTGVAGPEAYHGLDAGVMYIGIIFDDKEYVHEIKTNRKERNWNRQFCCLAMMEQIKKAISYKGKI
ncbi:MAG: competence/damage-inducible protein A [Eubacterium sp.]|nr:competence/damage-inducible protein A [Eubacterium sp.]